MGISIEQNHLLKLKYCLHISETVFHIVVVLISIDPCITVVANKEHKLKCTPRNVLHIKSVQSALSDLLTTSATHGTFSRPSTKRGLILICLELNTNARESFEHC